MHKVFAAIALCLLAIPGFAAPLTVVAFGDSLVQGYGLPPDQGLVSQLQARLRDEGQDVDLINAGVSGDTTAGGAARVDWTLGDGVDAMIVVLGGNDMLRGLDPALARANLDRILGAADQRGIAVLLVGMQAPGNYGPDYKQAFDAMYPELASAHGALLHPGFFDAFNGIERTPQAMRAFMQPDGIHPNAQGVARIVEDLLPDVLTLIARARAG